MTLKKIGAFALALMACSGACAQESDRLNQVWLDTGFITHHFQSDLDLNGHNGGVGMEYRFSESMAVTAGRFYNSDREHSRYAGLYYQPWSFHGVKLGAVVGGFDGYPKMREGGWFLALVPGATGRLPASTGS